MSSLKNSSVFVWPTFFTVTTTTPKVDGHSVPSSKSVAMITGWRPTVDIVRAHQFVPDSAISNRHAPSPNLQWVLWRTASPTSSRTFMLLSWNVLPPATNKAKDFSFMTIPLPIPPTSKFVTNYLSGSNTMKQTKMFWNHRCPWMFELSAAELAFESGRNPQGTISIGNHTVISSHLLHTNDLSRMPLSNFNLTFATGPLHRNWAWRLSIHTLPTLSQFMSSFPRHLPSTMTFTKSERFFSSSTPTLQSLPAPRKKK